MTRNRQWALFFEFEADRRRLIVIGPMTVIGIITSSYTFRSIAGPIMTVAIGHMTKILVGPFTTFDIGPFSSIFISSIAMKCCRTYVDFRHRPDQKYLHRL